jgi:hypothetical protein
MCSRNRLGVFLERVLSAQRNATDAGLMPCAGVLPEPGMNAGFRFLMYVSLYNM